LTASFPVVVRARPVDWLVDMDSVAWSVRTVFFRVAACALCFGGGATKNVRARLGRVSAIRSVVRNAFSL
jgi:hypothetical protein